MLLTHSGSPTASLRDLRGRSLLVQDNPRACLALPWLDLRLAQDGLQLTREHFGKVTFSAKLSKVVLPVFFRQADACLVARRGFDVMTELNPQVGKQLQILAVSPRVVPAVFAFRSNYIASFKENLFAGVRELDQTPAGQQVLTVFQSEKIEERSASCLDGALDLLAQHVRLASGPPSGAGSEVNPPSKAPDETRGQGGRP